MYYNFIKKLIINNFKFSEDSLNKIEEYAFRFPNVYIRVIAGDIVLNPVIIERLNTIGDIVEVVLFGGKKVKIPSDDGFLFYYNESEKYPLHDIYKKCEEIDELIKTRQKRNKFYRTPWILKSDLVKKEELIRFQKAIENGECLIVNSNVANIIIESIPLHFEDVDFNKKINEIKNEIKEALGFDYLEYDKKERLIVDEINKTNDLTNAVFEIYKNVRVRMCENLSKKLGKEVIILDNSRAFGKNNCEEESV